MVTATGMILHRFWKTQALIVAHRSITWKFLEPVHNVATFVPHIRFVINASSDIVEDLPASTRLDIALTLLEGVRFPKIDWKRFAISQA
ncbi:hypothetical protein M0657_011982 [Pyricularia oryzae]|nr:hypothetical protein M9X92_011903 [Pyricularia oryzae]KAI7909118.1 hypothetical protein M0657_011982 [Pyricularia oryzae]